MWPVDQTPTPTATLTDEERQHCTSLIRSLLPDKEGGEWYAHPDAYRVLLAYALFGLACRNLISAGFSPQTSRGDCRMGGGDPARPQYKKYVQNAIASASKACVICPLSLYFYDLGCIFRSVGKIDEAKACFTECLRRHRTLSVPPEAVALYSQRDVKFAISDASNAIGETSAECVARTKEHLPHTRVANALTWLLVHAALSGSVNGPLKDDPSFAQVADFVERLKLNLIGCGAMTQSGEPGSDEHAHQRMLAMFATPHGWLCIHTILVFGMPSGLTGHAATLLPPFIDGIALALVEWGVRTSDELNRMKQLLAGFTMLASCSERRGGQETAPRAAIASRGLPRRGKATIIRLTLQI